MRRVRTMACATQVEWAMEHQQEFSTFFWLDVFNKVLLSLGSSRTRHFNQPNTVLATRTVPTYYQIFLEDLHDLSEALRLQNLNETPFSCLSVAYGCWKFGQQQWVPVTEPTKCGPDSESQCSPEPHGAALTLTLTLTLTDRDY